MTEVIASLKDFDKAFPGAPKDSDRRDALVRYFSIGGVIKAHDTGKEWPSITYPSRDVLAKKLEEVRHKKDIYKEKMGSWKKSKNSAALYHQLHQFKKLKEPLYWKHLAKSATDPDYKKDSDAVKLPAHLVADKKWKPMVKMFVNDLEYRKQLSETVKTSIVYRKDKKVGKYADDLQGFRVETSSKQIVELEKKLEVLDKTEEALRAIQKWAKE